MSQLKITLKDLFNLNGAVLYNPDGFKPASFVSIDSRSVRKNTLFVAVKGDRFDGHSFIGEAEKRGACAVVVMKSKLNNLGNVRVPVIAVPDTVKAYGELAAAWRNKLGAKVISITGSNGKTSTKDILAVLLSTKYRVVKSSYNNNNHIGVPLTILSSKKGTEILVLEHGTNHFGEIEYTAKIARPDLALITNIGESHLEFLKNKNGVYKEKSKLFDECLANNGTLIINYDDPVIKRKTKRAAKKITYGFKGNPEFEAVRVTYDKFGRTGIKIKSGNIIYDLKLPLYGMSNALNVLAAVAVAKRLGVTKANIISGIDRVTQPKGRLNVFYGDSATLIDDTYNSNPVSMIAAIDMMDKIKIHKKSLLVLGDMFELGSHAIRYHSRLFHELKNVKNLELILIGRLMKHLYHEAKTKKADAVYFTSREKLKKYLSDRSYNDYKILVKGSRGMRMEEFAAIIKSRTV
ncbi:MAG: UDP-N-acetylmuramoyl-tripeptide--D-alanyl-D-alanine ligase [Melioribacteraceae bacterium]|nr:UDP-N-acetylmuramoyl-tripeptide--D-alanyl-D-alanine ligase [Melioribacteraceae bacterium]